MLRDVEVDPAQHLDATERLAQAVEQQRAHRSPPASRRRRSRSASQSVVRASGIVIATNRNAATRYGVKLNVALTSISAWFSDSTAPSTDTRAVSFCRPMKSFKSGGTTRRTACGRVTYRSARPRDNPSERAAASCDGCTDSIPARYTSET